MMKYVAKQPTSVFFQHMKESHRGEMLDLKLRILSKHRGDAMLRQITEAVNIRENVPDLNNKEEWGNSNVPKERKGRLC